MKFNCLPVLCTIAASTNAYKYSYGSYGNYNRPNNYANNYANNQPVQPDQPEPNSEPEPESADLNESELLVEDLLVNDAIVDDNPNIYHANHHDDNEACAAKKLLNDHKQIEVGFNTNKCLAIDSNFSNAYGLKGKSQVKIAECKTYQCPTQCFTQVYFDESDKSKFGICLKKYHDGPASISNWNPKYWCLFGRYSVTKIGKAKHINNLAADEKWQWSFNENGKLINSAMGGRTLNVNNAGKLKLLAGEEIWSFGHHFVDFKDDEEDLW